MRRLNDKGKALVIVIICLVLAIVIAPIASHYSLKGEIVAKEKDCVLVVDSTDNVWAFYEDEKETFEIGDKVMVKFYDKFTDFKEDDEIIEVKHLTK